MVTDLCWHLREELGSGKRSKAWAPPLRLYIRGGLKHGLQHCRLQGRGREQGPGGCDRERGGGAAAEMGPERWVSWRWWGKGRGRRGEGSTTLLGSREQVGVQDRLESRGSTPRKSRVINEAAGAWWKMRGVSSGAVRENV